MAKQICKYCSSEIKTKAILCLHCGKYQKKWQNTFTFSYLINSIIMLATVISVFFAGREATKAEEAKRKTEILKIQVDSVSNHIVRMQSELLTISEYNIQIIKDIMEVKIGWAEESIEEKRLLQNLNELEIILEDIKN